MNDQQKTLEQLRESLAQLEAGELESDLFAPGDGGEEPGPRADQRHESDANTAQASEDQYAKARAVVLRKLTGSAKSRHQLAEALREKEFSETVIAQVLDRMEEVHLVNDAEFARTWVRTRHEIKGLGAAALRRELQDKGVSAEHADAALEQISPADEHAAAREMVQTKLRGVTVPVGNGAEDRKERDKITRRLVGMLARRGHSPGMAFQLVREELEARSG
ncbi:regulatory protein RecX [Nesterenkonia flava]|uniref:Regulatory protein RecX n=1 Tax=Nesterenkonia flava TaxID=469799 RepID=A0ABU1FSL3_9MICC|nr:regulatory protein RecX [Nesterenkonia flava]MDR5711619.1 regulatory protein RecX [Nesterenkonia flava]